MATFILIHGAWHGSWCWERIVPLLEQQGHRVLAPDLPGMGNDPTPLTTITLDYWARFVADLVLQQEEPVLLLGHSRGGVVISQAAEYVSQSIQKLIYLAAFLVPNGETLVDMVRKYHPHPERRQDKYILSADKKFSTAIPQAIPTIFYNNTPEFWAKRAAELVGQEPMLVSSTPLMLSEQHFGAIPRIYIECLQDNAVPITMQRGMVSALPCQEVISLDTDHSPFYSTPELLAKELLRCAVS